MGKSERRTLEMERGRVVRENSRTSLDRRERLVLSDVSIHTCRNPNHLYWFQSSLGQKNDPGQYQETQEISVHLFFFLPGRRFSSNRIVSKVGIDGEYAVTCDLKTSWVRRSIRDFTNYMSKKS
jgi:hypothetical protein